MSWQTVVMPACVHRDQQDVETGICYWLLWFYWMLYLFFFFFFYILILQSPQLPYIYISVWEVECVAFILRLDGDISFKVKTCFISTGYGINGQRSVYLCLFDGVLTLYCAHTHLLLPLPNPERQRKDPLVKLLAPTRDNIYSAFILPCLRNAVLASADTGLPPRQA